jgi:solute carrier family 13 (sodium-dependent dicarboxylate transporter), member 2/3/5
MSANPASASDVVPVFANPVVSKAMRALRLSFAPVVAALACVWIFGADMPLPARTTLIAFVLATTAWICTSWSETGIALAATCLLATTGAIDSEQLFSGLGDDVIWLLIGGFLIAAAIRHSGVAERAILRALAGAGSVRGMFYRLTWLIVATAFVVPSTSGRAALLMPVYLVLMQALGERRLDRGLALLFPSVILLSACASLLGAGAHLVAVDFMAETGMRELDFLDWALLGTPFAILASAIATECILRLFVPRDLQSSVLLLPLPSPAPLSASQRNVALIATATVVAWATTALHAFDPALVALLGALAICNRSVSGISMKEAVKSVEWNLILFLAATLVLGEALLDSGAADWAARQSLRCVPAWMLAHTTWTIAIASAVSMLSHLLITSRSARAAVLIPALAIPLAIAPSQASMLIVVVVVGSGFCQTLRVSAKPVVLYSEHEGRIAYSDTDLMRLSLWLMPPFALLLMLFALFVWPSLGLGLSAI